VQGNAALAPNANYNVDLDSSGADLLLISGQASITGSLTLNPTGSFALDQQFTVLTAAHGLSGEFRTVNTVGSFGNNRVAIASYDADHAYVTVYAATISPFLPGTASTNQKSVASAIDPSGGQWFAGRALLSARSAADCRLGFHPRGRKP
jgi:outer membrane autotransporter protein